MRYLALLLVLVPGLVLGQSTGQGYTPPVVPGAVDSTRLVQDSILRSWLNGVVVREDTLRFSTDGITPAQLAQNALDDRAYADANDEVNDADSSPTNELQDASEVSVNPSGDLVATDVQAGLQELQADIGQNAVEDRAYADVIRKRSRVATPGLPYLAYRLGIGTGKVNVYAFGDSKLNQIHTISRLQANFGDFFGYAGVGYISLSTANNGRLGIIPRGTGSTPVEKGDTPFAKYAFDGQAQLLTGNSEFRLETNSSYTTYTENKECAYYDYAKLYYLRHPDGGQFRIKVDGVTLTTINANGSEAKLSYTITGLQDTTHLLEIENISGTNYTLDAYLMRSQAVGVIVNCVANSGFTAADFIDVWATSNKEIIEEYPPDMSLIRLGTNDSNGDVVPATFVSQVQQMTDTVLQYSPQSDVAWIGKEGTNLSATYSDTDYNSALKSGAITGGYAFVNLYDVVPDWSVFNQRGFSNDFVHENTTGSHYIGNFLFHSLMRSVPLPEAAATPTLQEVAQQGSSTNQDLTINGKLVLNDGANDVWIGASAGEDKTSGSSNIGIGTSAALNLTSGNSNTVIGLQGAFRLTEGEKNVVIGVQGHFNNRTGDENTVVGTAAGQLTESGAQAATTNDCVLLGARTRVKSDGATNEIVVGYDAIGNGSNTATFGNDNITATYLKGELRLDNENITGVATGTADDHAANHGEVRAITDRFRWGTGSPEGAVSAPVGTLYLRSDGGPGTTLYVKESGTGSTGWTAK